MSTYSILGSGAQIVDMGCHHGDLSRLECEELARTEIHLGRRFVRLEEIGGKNKVPRQLGMSGLHGEDEYWTV